MFPMICAMIGRQIAGASATYLGTGVNNAALTYLTLPTGIQAGDLLVVVLEKVDESGPLTWKFRRGWRWRTGRWLNQDGTFSLIGWKIFEESDRATNPDTVQTADATNWSGNSRVVTIGFRDVPEARLTQVYEGGIDTTTVVIPAYTPSPDQLGLSMIAIDYNNAVIGASVSGFTGGHQSTPASNYASASVYKIDAPHSGASITWSSAGAAAGNPGNHPKIFQLELRKAPTSMMVAQHISNTFVLPPGTVAGDLLIVVIGTGNSNWSATSTWTSNGWTVYKNGSGQLAAIAWKLVTAGDVTAGNVSGQGLVYGVSSTSDIQLITYRGATAASLKAWSSASVNTDVTIAGYAKSGSHKAAVAGYCLNSSFTSGVLSAPTGWRDIVYNSHQSWLGTCEIIESYTHNGASFTWAGAQSSGTGIGFLLELT